MAENRLLLGLSDLVWALRALRAPLLVSIFAGVVCYVPDQTRELYWILAQDYSTHVLQICGSLAALLLLSIAIFMLTWRLCDIHEDKAPTRTASGTLMVLKLLSGAIIPFSVAAALYQSARNSGTRSLPQKSLDEAPELAAYARDMTEAVPRLNFAALICLLIALGIIVAAALLPRIWVRTPHSILTILFGRKFVLSTALLLLACTAYYAIFQVSVPQSFGSIFVFFQFVLFLSYFTSAITATGDRYKIPGVTILILLTVGLSAVSLNDNHVVRTSPRKDVQLKEPKDAFRAWYEGRNDRSQYEAMKQPYPVFIVAAAGGGMYAAYHAATVLARLQDQCPNFAQHVFAISGVSGGSVGSAIFSSLAKKFAENGPPKECRIASEKGPFETQANLILSRDLLSPIAAAALFPDFLQRFLPAGIPGIDRARALEAGLEDAWKRAMPDSANAFATDFLDHWSPTQVAPALVLNTTNVDHGHRVVISPMRLAWSDPRDMAGLLDFHSLFEKDDKGPVRSDIRLSTAATMSARFPWILPAATIQTVDRTTRLIDGGLYENSGIETSLDIIARLKEWEKVSDPDAKAAPYIKIYLIIINGYQNLPGQQWQGEGETLSPIRAMLSAREQRGSVAMFRGWLDRWNCGIVNEKKCDLDGIKFFLLNHQDFRLPLGWQLSEETRKLIRRHAGSPRSKRVGSEAFYSKDQATRILSFLSTGDGSACEILVTLHPKTAQELDCHNWINWF